MTKSRRSRVGRGPKNGKTRFGSRIVQLVKTHLRVVGDTHVGKNSSMYRM